MTSHKESQGHNEADFKAHALLLPNTQSFQTTIQITSVVVGGAVGLEYSTLPGNQPSVYGNQVALWQASGLQIPYGQAPVTPGGITQITSPSQQGSTAVGSSLSNLSYVVGFSVGPVLPTTSGAQAWGNICAIGWIPSAGSPAPYQYYAAQVGAVVQSTSLLATYNLPTASTPQTNNAWIGVWQGQPNFYVQTPGWSAPIVGNGQVGSVPFNNVPIVRGLTYTVVLFMSGYSATPASLNQQPAAAAYTFSN